MKVDVHVDCTPDEARRLMGLPDLAPVHEVIVQQMVDAVRTPLSPELLQSLMTTWAPFGEAGQRAWQTLFEAAGKR